MGDDADRLVVCIVEKLFRRTFVSHFYFIASINFFAEKSDATVNQHFPARDELVRSAARRYALLRELFIDAHWIFVRHAGTIPQFCVFYFNASRALM